MIEANHFISEMKEDRRTAQGLEPMQDDRCGSMKAVENMFFVQEVDTKPETLRY